MKIYGDRISGNCQKVKFTADFLGLRYEWVDVDIMKGESRTPEFLALNPAGQVPIVVFDDGRALAQSNAIVLFLARGKFVDSAKILSIRPRPTSGCSGSSIATSPMSRWRASSSST